MKIRTDFVTNSSSSNFVTISVKSPKLTELMHAARICEENGEQDEEHYLGRLNINKPLNIDESKQIVKFMLEISHIVSYVDEDMEQTDREYIGYPPETLSDLPECLLRLLKETGKCTFLQQGYDLEKICGALEKEGEDILADMESADWAYDTEGHGEANLFGWFWTLSKNIARKEHLDYRPSSAALSCSFHYDRETGESLKGEYSYGEPDRENFDFDDLDASIGFSEDDLEVEMEFKDDEDVRLIDEGDPNIL